MAKIISETVTISFSTLVRSDAEDVGQLVNEQRLETLDAAMQELFGEEAGMVIEVSKNDES